MSVAVYSVPGLFGTGLYTAVPSRYGRSNSLYWISKTRLASYLLDGMVLSADGITPPSDVGTVLNAKGLYPAIEWQTLDNAISDGPHVSFDFPYDWRKDLRTAAASLANVLAIAALSDDYAVVCHSGGAVVTLLAWAALSTAARAKCRRVVWIDPCFGGSYDGIRGMAGGYWSMYGFGALTAALAAVLNEVDNPLAVPPSQEQRLLRAVASWPGLYQLFPNPGGMWVGLDPNLQAVYDVNRWSGNNNFVTQDGLNGAAAVQASVILAMNATLPPSVIVRSDDALTQFRLNEPKGSLFLPDIYDTDTDGDGVVPTIRATLPGVPVLTLAGQHQTVMGSTQLASRIISLIDNGLPADTDVPGLPVFVGPKTLTPPNSPGAFVPAPFPATAPHVDP